MSQNNSHELNQNEHQSPPNNLESSLDVTKLAEILADLTAGDIPPATNTISSELRTHGESSNNCHVDQTINRLEGKFVSNNVFNLSRRNLSDSEIQVLSKGFTFVPTPKRLIGYKLRRISKTLGEIFA